VQLYAAEWCAPYQMQQPTNHPKKLIKPCSYVITLSAFIIVSRQCYTSYKVDPLLLFSFDDRGKVVPFLQRARGQLQSASRTSYMTDTGGFFPAINRPGSEAPSTHTPPSIAQVKFH
jgi:hypothetical protein